MNHILLFSFLIAPLIAAGPSPTVKDRILSYAQRVASKSFFLDIADIALLGDLLQKDRFVMCSKMTYEATNSA